MKDKEVLQKAIEIAIGNGWKHLYSDNITSETCDLLVKTKRYMTFLFSHDFAKAFWGSECTETGVCYDTSFGGAVYMDAWEHHLQQMVLEENPINYLRKFINTEKSK
tara:strand:- start:128 stop:448 length:321 start_codon:yes stop_codon:yes gene_type:complete